LAASVHDEDAKVVKAAQAGDRRAFDELVERYQRRVVAVALRMLGNVDDSLEAAQDAFINAYQGLDKLKEPGSFGAWLMRIVTNQSLNYRRARSRRNRLIVSGQSDGRADQENNPLLEQAVSTEPSPAEQLAADELSGRLQQGIDELPENLRTALVLFSVGKLPQKEIADIMGCSVQMVKWNVFEARKRLRRHLAKA